VIRTIWVVLHLVLATVPLGILTILAYAVGVRGDFFYRIPRFWARWVLWAAHTPVRTFGAEHVALDRPQIIAANHVSWFDVVALAGYLPKRNRFIAKKELKNVPIFGWAWQVAGHIAIDRSNTARAVDSLDLAARLVREDNSCIVIFPEGTRSESKELLPFKKGAFMLALHAGLDIVPLGVQGTRKILPKHGWRVRSGPIILRFGPPIVTSAYGEDGRDRLMWRVRSEIERLSQTPPDSESKHVRHH
jgi:1-acyl-sn-glycerol-3-phosphate acyltransferase